MDIDVQSLSQFEKDQLLIQTVISAEQEDLSKVKDLIAAGANIDSFNLHTHCTALIYSILRNHHDTIKFLLEKNASVNILSYYSSENALMFAIKHKNPIWIIQLLIEKGSKLDHKDCAQYTALDKAIEHQYMEAVYCLLRAKSYDDIESFSKISTKNAEIVSGLLKHDRETLFTILLYNKKLESELIPEITNYVIQILASQSASSRIGHLSKWYMASPFFEKDVTVFIDILRQKREFQAKKASQDNTAFCLQQDHDAQDFDAIFSQETTDLTPQIPTVIFSEEPKEKSCSEMIIEGFSIEKEGIFNLFSNKRKRDESEDKDKDNQEDYDNDSNPHKKSKMN